METKDIKLKRRLIKYILVGFATALVDYLAFTVLFLISGNYIIAENLKLPITLGFNYFAHRSFTFKSQNRFGGEVYRYILANILIFIVANVSLILLVYLIDNVQLAKLLQLATMPIFTYILLNYMVYKPKKVT